MLTHERNTSGLKASAQKKREEAFQRAEQAIKDLLKAGKRITFQAVHEAGNVSVAWLYKEEVLRQRIEYLRDQGKQTKGVPQSQRASNASSNAIVKTMRERLKKLEAENRGLRSHLEVAYGLSDPQLQQAIEDLQKENDGLRKENQRLVNLLIQRDAELEAHKRHKQPS